MNPLLAQLEELTLLGDNLRMHPSVVSHVLFICVCRLKLLERLPILSYPTSGYHSMIDFNRRPDISCAEWEVELHFAAVQRHYLYVVRPRRELR